MNVERTGPVTHGQLSVLRSLESYGTTGQAVANLVSIWDIPAGASVAHAADAWQQLVTAHESLRTVYSTGHERPAQSVLAPRAASVPAVEVPDATHGATRDLAATWAAEPLDIRQGPPWRAFVAVHRGAPLYLVTVIHHIAADNTALHILREQFERLAMGEVLGPQEQPVDLALAQLEDGDDSRAVRHWSRHWDGFSPEDRQEGDVSVRRRATLHSVEGLRAAGHVSRRAGVSLQTVVLAVGAVALARVRRRDRITFGLMAANRLDERWSSLVSSLNQCVPLSVRVDEEAAPDDFLRTTYQTSMNAYLYGCFDVDVLKRDLNESGRRETDPTFFSSHYNFLGPGDGEPPLDSPLRTGCVWRASTQRIGPNFHLAVAVESGILIGVGASVDFLPGDLPAVLAASIEGGLVALADEPPESLRELRLAPCRDIGRSSSSRVPN
ncbi:condensation domain-containing protein [Streptomyces sp. NPDC014734]|uniref:condensation domain-containing protein n=1 Tax=Streptomyces sp. NPDC014734 TaxID=3364886 RepID=UPI0037004654